MRLKRPGGLYFLILPLLVNPLADYISLIETRRILRLTSKGRLRYWPLWLLFDFSLTASILIFGYCIVGVIVYIYLVWIGADMSLSEILYLLWLMERGLWGVLFNMPSLVHEGEIGVVALRPFIWSTYSTSIIFYIYCLSALSFKLLGLAKTRLLNLLQRLEENDRLFKALGVFLSTCLVFIRAMIAVVQYMAQGF